MATIPRKSEVRIVQQAAPETSLPEPEPTALAHGQAMWLAASFEHAFSSTALTVGLEEELILVDPELLVPVDAIEPVLAAVEGDERFAAEVRASQVELRTPVCLTAADACRELSGARKRLLSALRLMAVGTHPAAAAGPVAVTARERQARVVLGLPPRSPERAARPRRSRGRG
jgi:hypothetical protein